MDLGLLAAVLQNVGICAAGFFQRVGQDRQVLKAAFVVDRPGEGDGGWSAPSWIEGHGAEGVAEDVTHQMRLSFQFSQRCRGCDPLNAGVNLKMSVAVFPNPIDAAKNHFYHIPHRRWCSVYGIAENDVI